jgi:hypothetical protein
MNKNKYQLNNCVLRSNLGKLLALLSTQDKKVFLFII